MKLRLDLLEHLTDEDILEEVLANNHRYKPEPNFSKTGVGSLSSASIEERAQEEARSTARIQRAMERLKQSGEQRQSEILSLDETIEFLRHCHRRAPFLFFNGNTFADVGRTIVDFVFADLPTTRRREVMSAVAHYIAGVLDHDAMVQIVKSFLKRPTSSPATASRPCAARCAGRSCACSRWPRGLARRLRPNSLPCRKA